MAKERSTKHPEPGALIADNLRRAAPEDAALIASWLNRSTINRYLSSELRSGSLQPGHINAGLRRPDQFWTIFSRSGGVPAGLVALDSIDRIDGLANIWYVLGDTGAARRGLTSAAIDLFCGINPLALNTLTAWIAEPNTASIRCLEKAGFNSVGRYSGTFVQRNQRYDRILYERILKL